MRLFSSMAHNHYMSMMSVLFIALFLFISTANADEGFPGRKIYPSVKVLTHQQLFEKMNNEEVVIVDVRSEYEYQTLKVLNSINIPVAKKSFPQKLKKLRESTVKDIVFYCNGRSCYKSYKAGIKAIKYNVKNCYSYDAGVFEWAQAYPDLAVLLDETPVMNDSIISKDDFKSRMLAPSDFSEKSLADKSIIYDIRDREQRRGGSGLFMFRDKHIELANIKKLEKAIRKAVIDQTTMFFYDQKGKQVRWLQYTLEAYGLDKYYFMKGGANAFYAMLREQQQ